MKQLTLILLIFAVLMVPSFSFGSQSSQEDPKINAVEPIAPVAPATPIPPDPSIIPWPKDLPVYDHIVIVVEENKRYEQIIYDPDATPQPWPLPWPAPYINKLKAEGANFTKIYGEEHFSQGNYFWLFSGSQQDITYDDVVPNQENNPNYPFTTPNLASQLIKEGLTFIGYIDSMPADPMQIQVGTYARKHVPWLSFANVPPAVTINFDQFPKDAAGFAKLPNVSFVVPDLEHDMHNPPFPNQIQVGDKWLEDNLGPYYEWAKNNNSLLIVTFDENDDARKYQGLTNPMVDPQTSHLAKLDKEYAADVENRIVTIFAGAHIIPGDYVEGNGLTHVNILRTIEAMYGLPRAGKQQPNALGAGIKDDYIITDIFKKIK